MTVITKRPHSTTASLTFFSPPTDGSRPFVNTDIFVEGGARKSNIEYVKHEVEIRNARVAAAGGNSEFESDLRLDTGGFELVRSATGFDFAKLEGKDVKEGDAEIEREYYPESVQLLKERTGASRVVIFDHTIRRRRPGVADTRATRQPAPTAHVDQTPSAAIARVHRHLPAEDVPELLKHRIQLINLWRPINHAAVDWPLALADYRTVKDTFRSESGEGDVVPVALIYPDREGQICGVKYSDKMRWYYYYGMEPDECVLIKCFDSSDDPAISKFTPHTAFEDPTTPEGAPFRESIELRALVFYDD